VPRGNRPPVLALEHGKAIVARTRSAQAVQMYREARDCRRTCSEYAEASVKPRSER
jgi:hypothetical protein